MARGLEPAASAAAARSARWPDGAVVYEIYPRSFQDSDGDGIGDLPGIRSRLPYLEWLGVDAIWLAPIYASPLADYGYDVSDHRAIAPEYGTDRDFDLLVADAHDRGIRVVLDLVVSHTSIEHPWFRERPDFYVWADGPEPPNNWLASFGGTGLEPRPGQRPAVPALLLPRAARPRLAQPRRARGDGGRRPPLGRSAASTASGSTPSTGWSRTPELRDDPPAEAPFPLPMPEELRQLDLIHSRDSPDIALALATLREAAGDVPLIGEVYLPVARVLPYLEYLDAAFAFDLLHADWDAEQLAAAIERSNATGGVAWVTSNHDFPRVATRWGEENARAAAVLLLTLGGTAFVYQGEELGMVDGARRDPPRDRFGRDGCRRPMQWDGSHAGGFTPATPGSQPVDPESRNVDSEAADEGSVLNLFRRLIELRREIDGDPVRVELAGGDARLRPRPPPDRDQPRRRSGDGAAAGGGDRAARDRRRRREGRPRRRRDRRARGGRDPHRLTEASRSFIGLGARVEDRQGGRTVAGSERRGSPLGEGTSERAGRARRRSVAAMLLGCLVAAALVISACGDDESGGPTELSFFIFNEPSGILPKIADSCSKSSNGEYTVSFEYLPNEADQQREQLVRRLGAQDSSIDIMGMDVIWTGEFANAGWVEQWTGADETGRDRGRLPERRRDRPVRGQALGGADLDQHAAALVPHRPGPEAAARPGTRCSSRRRRSARTG